MDVRMPDGVLLRNVPDGTPKAAIMERYQRSKRMAALPKSMENIAADQAANTPVLGGFDNVRAGAGKAFYDLARGAGQLVGAVSREDVAQSRAQDAPLMQTAGGKVGNLAGNVAAAVPAMFVPGANTVAGAGALGAGLGLLQPSTSTRETLTNVGAGGALGAGGQWAGQKIGGVVAKRLAQATDDKAANAVLDQTMREIRDAGYVLPPSTINKGSKLAVATESMSGRAATHQTAAFRNQKITNRLIREDLGLAKNAPLSRSTLKGIRTEAGKVYEAVAKSGRIKPDQQYLNEVANLSAVMDDVASEFPGAAAPSGDKIRELADSLFQPDFDADAALKYTRSLREQAKGNFQSVHSAGGNAEALSMARAQQEAAGVLEDMILRHLRATGKAAVADSFDAARVRIAKSYSAEAALNEATGNIVAKNLGAQLRRNKPLSGNFQKVAKFAEAAGPAAAEVKSGPGVSALSAILSSGAGVAGLVSGNPAGLALATLPLGRTAARQAILSNAGQALAAPGYGLGAGGQSLRLLQGSARAAAPIGLGFIDPEQEDAL
jgi:hypothetical protein